MQTSLVERTFENISFLRSSMNRTFAATWKITETRSVIVRLSTDPKPKPSTLVSPRTGINFFKLDGLSFLNLSNSYEHGKSSRRDNGRMYIHYMYIITYYCTHQIRTSTRFVFLLTGNSSIFFNLSSIDSPAFGRINMNISPTSGQDLSSFSINTFPRNPVPPVTKIFRPT